MRMWYWCKFQLLYERRGSHKCTKLSIVEFECQRRGTTCWSGNTSAVLATYVNYDLIWFNLSKFSDTWKCRSSKLRWSQVFNKNSNTEDYALFIKCWSCAFHLPCFMDFNSLQWKHSSLMFICLPYVFLKKINKLYSLLCNPDSLLLSKDRFIWRHCCMFCK